MGMDANGDGALTSDEITSAHPGKNPSGVAHWVDSQDANHDGVLNCTTEFHRGGKGGSSGFGGMDANNDGSLTVAEIAQATGRSEASIEAWVHHADSDGDGALSQSEFDAAKGRKGSGGGGGGVSVGAFAAVVAPILLMLLGAVAAIVVLLRRRARPQTADSTSATASVTVEIPSYAPPAGGIDDRVRRETLLK